MAHIRTPADSAAKWIMESWWSRVKNCGAGLCPMCYHPAGAHGIREKGFSHMSAFKEYREELEQYEQMFGLERGRLAVSLDRMTNALVLVGQHGVYCTSLRNPTVPAMDIRVIVQELTRAKELVQSVMEELKQAREARRRGTVPGA
jgi:hypothetical protein